MAIFSLNHRSIGRSTHAPRTGGYHIRYITRPGACSLTLSARMPLDRHQARSWLDGQEQTDRKNGRVCDKLMLALPLELTAEQRAELVRDFAEQVTQGKASYFAAIHDKGEDAANPHCHLVIRDRDPESKKRVIGLSETGSTEKLRATWEQVANTHLERAGSPARIDRRSLEAQGIERDAGIHVGPKGPAMEQHKGLRPESQERDERRPSNQPYKRRKRRKTPYPNIDRGRTRAEANAERQARNSARTKLKPVPVDDADRPEPATRNAAITARAVEEKEPGAARQELAGQDGGATSADLTPPPREERSDPRTEDRERDAPASPGRAWSRARDQAHAQEGVQLGRVIDGMADGLGNMLEGVAESLWSLLDGDGGRRKPMSHEQEKGAGAAWAKAAQQKAEAEQARQAENVKQVARHRGMQAQERSVVATGSRDDTQMRQPDRGKPRDDRER